MKSSTDSWVFIILYEKQKLFLSNKFILQLFHNRLWWNISQHGSEFIYIQIKANYKNRFIVFSQDFFLVIDN